MPATASTAEQPLDGAGVDGKNVTPGHALTAGQAVEEPFVGALARERWRETETLAGVPRQDGVDGLAEHGQGRFEGQRVPQERPEQVVAHGKELRQHALPHRPGEDSAPMARRWVRYLPRVRWARSILTRSNTPLHEAGLCSIRSQVQHLGL